MKICIESQDDGTFLVGEDAPMGEGGMPEMGEALSSEMAQDPSQGMQPAASLDEALEMARQLLQDDGTTPEQQVQAGYDKGQRQMPAKMGPGAVFGE